MTKKEFVSMSLPYGLKVVIPESDEKGCRRTVIGTVGAVFNNGSICCYDTVNACPRWYKPILYRLSDISRFNPSIVENFLNIETIELLTDGMIFETKLSAFELRFLVQNHFDIIGIIAKGQAIRINTLGFNPYKKK